MTNSEITKIWIKNFQVYCQNKPEIFEHVLDLAFENKIHQGREFLRINLPFKIHTNKDKKYYSDWQKLNIKNTRIKENISSLKPKNLEEIFNRDFYQCRFTGTKLLSLEAISLLKYLYHIEFPYPKYNGNYLITHIDIWTFYPQVDHLIPLKSPKNDLINSPSNLATISSTFNINFKNDLSINDIGIDLIPISNLDSNWDGLKSKSLKFMNEHERVYQALKKDAEVHYAERLDWARTQKKAFK